MTLSPPSSGSTQLHACTIAPVSRLPEARVLVDTFREHHPAGRFTVLVVDDDPGRTRPEIAGAEVLLLDEIGLDERDRLVMGVCNSDDELARVVKPWLLITLLDGSGDHAIYLDPDVLIARELADLPRLARDGSIVLTPHLTEPLPRDGRQPSEQDIVDMGVYDAGVVAVGDDDNARRMLAWWQTRLRTDARDDTARGPFTDRRWIDLVPGLFDHHIVRDPSWSVAYWNLATRRLTRGQGGEVLVCDRPLTFFHFSGYSPSTPYLLSAHAADSPRVRLSKDLVLRELCDDYAARLTAAGYADVVELRRRPFSHFDGVELDSVIRRLVLTETRDQELGKGTGLDLASGGAALREWLLGRDVTVASSGALGRYFAALWAVRPDLHAVYPEVGAGDPSRFLDWCEVFGLRELGLASWPLDALRERYAAIPARADVPAGAAGAGTALVPGVEVVGFLSADLGIGQAARMLVAGLEAAGVEVSTTTYTNTSSRLGTPWTDRPGPANGRHEIVIVGINADMLPTFIRADGGAELLADRYVIGFWFWELDDFPEHFRPALEPLDELWVTSDFTADVLRGVTDIPVHTLPLPVHAPRDTGVRIPEVVDDGTFTFLFVFDYLSVLERKNPLGLVDAFVRAFPEPGQARLVIKTINADKRAAQQEWLRYAVAERPDIVLVERYLSRDELDGLMWAADCYVSLHRSEGFGFTMAEAMAIGKPVIATGYSGNMTFMSPRNSRLVDHAMVHVPPGCEPYPVTSMWAKPRLPHAARLMKRVRGDAELRERLALHAAADIAEHHSVEALADFVRRRLPEIHSERAAARRTGGRRLLDRLTAADQRVLRRRP